MDTNQQTGTPSPTAPLTPETTPELNDTQTASVAAWIREDLAKGRITAEAAQRAFDELGTPATDRAPVMKTEAARELEAAGFIPAKAEDFTLRMYPPGEEPAVVPQEVRDFETTARGYLVDAGFSRENGQALINAIDRTARVTKGMSPDQLEAYRVNELSKMQRIHGEKLDERLQAADDMLDIVERSRPGVKQLLRSHGVGTNALIWSLLIDHAQIFHARRGR